MRDSTAPDSPPTIDPTNGTGANDESGAIEASHTSDPRSDMEAALTRPASERRREFKYRLAQTLVFGLPVLALQYLGPRLGGPESLRWIALLQSLLAGWVVYVAAAGLLFEGLLLLRQRLTLDLVVAAASITLYLYSALMFLALLATARPHATYYHAVVLLLALWCAWRSWQLKRAETT